MNATISFICFILIVVPQSCFALKCYVCTSSQISIYDADCDNGTNTVRTGTCPTNFKACSVKRFIYPDGTTGVLRDCAITVRDETLLTGQEGLETTEYTCNYDLCNDFRVESEISTIPSTSLNSSTSSTSLIPSTSTTATSAASMTSAHLSLLVSIWAFAELLRLNIFI